MATAPERPTVLIVEPYGDMAVALEEIASLAHCKPVIVSDIGEPRQFQQRPAAIVVRVAASLAAKSPHHALASWPKKLRPIVIALTSSEEDVSAAKDLDCDIVLREPRQVGDLYRMLKAIAESYTETER